MFKFCFNYAFALVIFLFASVSYANSDGCFHMYTVEQNGGDGGDNGVICVSGSNEEGIDGAGARVVLVDTVGEVYWCAKTTKSSVDELVPHTNKITFHFDKKTGMRWIRFNGVMDGDGKQSGTVTFSEFDKGSTFIRFYSFGYLDVTKTLKDRVSEFFASQKCKDAGVF